jgi:D-amino-acid dehydrogenase
VLNAYATEETYASGRREAESSELPFQAFDRDDALALEPALGPRTVGAVYYPREAHVDPLRFVHALGSAAARDGADVRTRVEVRRLRRVGDGVVVESSEGELRPETVVLAAGVWSRQLARTAGVYCPLEGGKGYHVDLESADGDPRIPTWLQESWAIATPLPGRLRLAGTLELAGLDLTVDPVRADAVRRGGERGLRGLEGRRVIDVWAGLRPCAPDGLPVIGRPEGLRGLVLATGHAMKGVSLAPVTAQLVGELVAEESQSHDPRPFDPNRFRPLLRLGS